MSKTAQTVKSLENEINANFSELTKLISKFPVEKQSCIVVGTYNFKDVVAHIMEWENFALQSMKLISEKKIQPHKLNIKQMNLEFYEKNKTKTLTELLNLLERSHGELLKYLSNFDEALLRLPDPYYPEKHTVYTLIQHCSSLHYPWAVKFLKSFQKRSETNK